MKPGDIVTIRPQWLDAGADPARQYEIVENYGEGRVAISPVSWPWRFRPREVVRVEMLDPV